MRLIKFTLLLIIAVSFSLFKPILAQDNYLPGNIVNLNGDTIKGFIEYLDWRINPEQVYFKQDQDKERELYKPGNIKSFQFSGFVFRSKIVNVSNLPRNENNANYLTIPNSRRLNKFLKLIVESEVSLYQLIDELDIDHYYIELPNDTLDELIYFKYLVEDRGRSSINTNFKYKGQLTYYLRACNEIKESIQQADYKLKDLAILINSYNHCIGKPITYHFNYEESMTYKRKQSRFKIGLYAGVSFTKLNFHGGEGNLPYILNSEFPGSIKPAFGLIMNIEPARARGHWSIVLDLIIRSYSTSAKYTEYISNDWYRFYDVNLGATYITLNPMWRYYFLTDNIRPYLNAGFYFGSQIARTNSVQIEEYYHGNTTIHESSALGYSGFDFGFTLGGGVYVKKFSFDLRYNYGGLKAYDVGSNIQSIAVMIGYTF